MVYVLGVLSLEYDHVFFCSLGVLHVFASGATEVKKSVGWSGG